MRIKSIKVHNFRSVKDAIFDLNGYSLLVGENNAGKSNLMNALRVFYEDGVKYNYSSDFPKFETDSDSWMEIVYKLDDEENEALKKSYRSSGNLLKVRKYFYSKDKEKCKSNQSNIYCYENGVLSKKLFYGAKNISQAKLGKVIYIPEVSKTIDAMKLTGPSPFRDLLNLALKSALSTSPAYQELQKSFSDFNASFYEECSDGLSINTIINDINKSLDNWGVNFGVDINPVDTDTIIKSLVSHYIEDKNLSSAKINIESYGQGMQRHIIFTLIRLASKYTDISKPIRKDVFDPQYILLLFEEPEAFLHPCQQEVLNYNLRKMAVGSQQVMITSHSPSFVSRNIEFLPSLIKINKESVESKAYQISNNDIDELFASNSGLYEHCCELLADDNTEASLKKCLKKEGLGVENPDIDAKLEEESLKYLLWIDSERASMFFSSIVLICEGATEKAFFEYMLNEEWSELKDKNLYILDSMGKFNIHRYMNLLGKIGIKHSVLFDLDNNGSYHKVVNDFIKKNRNEHTQEILNFPNDLETFLELKVPSRKDLKPISLMQKLRNGEIGKAKLEQLRELFLSVLEFQP